ncbi:hypothetical protein BD769DRAFT_875993 [Suillus cothurnatus]|nr:hypothetical protein BD769DRAFT_875993 [Suillus cothurnatus]
MYPFQRARTALFAFHTRPLPDAPKTTLPRPLDTSLHTHTLCYTILVPKCTPWHMQIFAAFGILAASRAYIWVLSPCRTLPTPYCHSPHFYHSINLLSLPYNSNRDLIPIAITLLTTTFTSALNVFASFSPHNLLF